MAVGSTIYKCNLNIANMDTHYYDEQSLTLAKHPSETDLRVMIRLIAYVLNANEALEFTRGISDDEAPDLWQKSLTGDIELWIDIGQPDEKRIKKASGRSEKVVIYIYQEGAGEAWFKQNTKVLKRFSNISVIYLKIDGDLEAMASRSMNLQCNVSDGELTLINDDDSVLVHSVTWKEGI